MDRTSIASNRSTCHPALSPLARLLVALIVSAAFVACRPNPEPPGGDAKVAAEATAQANAPASPATMDPRAAEITRRLLLVDTHIDVPYRLIEDPEDVSRRTLRGEFDYERARTGGLDVAFMSIYVPSAYQTGGAKVFADGLIDLVDGLARRNPDRFALVTSADQAAGVLGTPRVGLALGIENGAPIENDLANLRHFHARGVRYVTLTHGADNQICDSSYSPAGSRRWQGLSPFGREVVAEMNRLGMMIDISHVSDQAFDQVLALSRAPLIASHSSARAFTPGFERNLDDERIRQLGAAGGVILINFGSSFLTEEANRYSVVEWAARRAWQAERTAAGKPPTGDEVAAYERERRAEAPYPFATIGDVADHIDHVVRIAGHDAVGIGSDYDGVGDSLPEGLKDVSTYPNLVAELLRRGWSEENLAKLLGGNLIRAWRQVESLAKPSSAAG